MPLITSFPKLLKEACVWAREIHHVRDRQGGYFLDLETDTATVLRHGP